MAVDVGERLARESPGDAQTQQDVSVSYNKLGDVTLQLGQAEQALGYYRQGLEIAERLARESPGDAQAQRDVMVSRYKLGGVLHELGKYAEEIVEYRAGIAILDRMIARGQNRESAANEKGILEGLVAECERLLRERKE